MVILVVKIMKNKSYFKCDSNNDKQLYLIGVKPTVIKMTENQFQITNINTLKHLNKWQIVNKQKNSDGSGIR